ncbi:MAG: response regulator transcription factor [Gammaproteobacteria bacterium]
MKTDATVYVIDDDEAVRDSLGMLIESAGYQVETYPSGEAFLDTYTQDRNGCLILDIRMPGMNGIQLQQELSERQFNLPIIFITGHGDIPMAVDAIKRGAADFLAKPFQDEVLLQRIDEVLKEYSEKLQKTEEQKIISQCLTELTERETEVMLLMTEGKANKVIASDLDISQRTVEIHRGRVMKKMQARSLAQLVRMLMQVNYLSSR